MMSLDLETDVYESAGTELIMDAVYGMQDMYACEQQYAKVHGFPRVTQQSVSNKLSHKNKSIVNRWLNGKENLTLRSIAELARALNHRARLTFEHIPEQHGNGEGIDVLEAPLEWRKGAAVSTSSYKTSAVTKVGE